RVIKVENPHAGGDMTRHWKVPEEPEEQPVSAYYASINWGKEVRQLDLRDAQDRQIIYDLLPEVDVVITNYKPGSAQSLGMDEATLRQHNPRIIYGWITGFGPDDARTAYDVILQAESGLMAMNGTPDSGPVKVPIALIDVLAAHQLKEGLLVALLEREKTGNGSLVTTSLLDAALSSLINQASNWLMAGHLPQRMGSEHPNIAPYGDLFTSGDGLPVVLAIGTDRQFTALCDVLGQAELAHHPDFARNAQRLMHRDDLRQALQPLIAAWNRKELLDRLLAQNVPAGAILTMKEVFETQRAQEMVLEEMQQGVRTARVRSKAFTVESRA
ncbi:MAG: CoA transferase, partial [Bacteroidota bacterium]